MACRTIESPRSRLISISVSMGAAVFLSKAVIQGGYEPFVMELPPYRFPTLKSTFHHMWDKGSDFVRMVGGIILVGSIIVWALQAFPRHVEMSMDYDAKIASLEASHQQDEITKLRRAQSQERLGKSYLGIVGVAASPVFAPLGFDWKDTVAIITGFFAKEVVVASYAVMYAQDDGLARGSKGLRAAIAGAMTPLTAFALMVFILLYSPCLSTIAVIKREAGGWKWAGFSVIFSLTIAWSLAFIITFVGGLLT